MVVPSNSTITRSNAPAPTTLPEFDGLGSGAQVGIGVGTALAAVDHFVVSQEALESRHNHRRAGQHYTGNGGPRLFSKPAQVVFRRKVAERSRY